MGYVPAPPPPATNPNQQSPSRPVFPPNKRMGRSRSWFSILRDLFFAATGEYISKKFFPWPKDPLRGFVSGKLTVAEGRIDEQPTHGYSGVAHITHSPGWKSPGNEESYDFDNQPAKHGIWRD